MSSDRTDANDLARVAGLQAVRNMVDAAQPPDAANEAPQPANPASKPTATTRDRRGKHKRSSTQGDTQLVDAVGPDRFELEETGLYYRPPGDDDVGRRRVCDPLRVVALARDQQSNGWALLVEFETPDRETRRLLIPLAALGGDGSEWRRALLHAGFMVPTDASRRRWLTAYLETRRSPARVRLVDRMGWHGGAFVTPCEAIGAAGGEDVLFHTEAPVEDAMGQGGTLAEWQRQIGRYCMGNSRLLLAVCTALAGPLLKPAGQEGGGLNALGNSGIGKTTFLRVAASVYGGPKFMRSARGTDNAMESLAAQHCDLVLLLDEAGQLDGRIAGDVSYLLANGSAKNRATRTGQARPTLTWRLLFVFTGEVSLSQHMGEAGKRMRAGQELRMVDVPADAGAGLGLFEQLHDQPSGAALSRHLTEACARQYGTLGRLFIEWAVQHHADLPGRIREGMDAFAADHIPEAAGGQVDRVGRRFALIATAGELATEAGLTAWPKGEATRGVRDCFHAWIASRGGIGNAEEGQMLRQVRRFLELHGESRFHWWHRAADDRSPNTANRAGFRKLLTESGQDVRTQAAHQREFGDEMHPKDGEQTLTEFYVLGEVFRREVAEGFDPVAVARVLADRGHLVTEKGGRLDRKERLPGIGLARCYRIKPSVFDDDGH